MKLNFSKLQHLFYGVLVIFLLFDIAHSYRQFYTSTLDGDFAESIAPTPSMAQTMNDPLGIKTVIEKEYHHNPNRFFCHWIFQKSFREIPLFLQNFTNPIDSVYATCALFKILFQLSLIVLLCWAIRGNTKIFNKDFILTAALITPLFQGYGWARSIGLIDISTTYAFFYAMPSIFLITYFLPLISEFFHDKKKKIYWPIKLLWIPLAILVCFSGPLNPGIVLIVSLMLVVQKLYVNYFRTDSKSFFQKIWFSIRSIPKKYYFYLLPINIISLYSLYVGSYSYSNLHQEIPLIELYARLPKGFFSLIIRESYVFLWIILLVNIFLIATKYRSAFGKRILSAFVWVGIFMLIYVLLLPLGGYRAYRPDVIRYDTFSPVILCLFFLFGISTLYLIKRISNRTKIRYYPLIAGILVIFTITDMKMGENSCEKQNLWTIAESKEDIVRLPNNCPTVAWEAIENPEHSYYSAEMLYMWRITDRIKLYYNDPEKK